jgi:hypothetical protein
MQYMTMLKMREDVGPPPAELIAAMSRYVSEVAATGRLVSMGGMLPSEAGAQVRATAGSVVVSHGPFTETTELVGGYAVFEVDSKDQAIEMARDFVQLHVDHWPGWEGVAEVRQIMAPPPD